jgi:peptide deformylase
MAENEFYELVDEMFSVMYDHAGQGLAAPQVGLNHRLFVINSAGKTWTFIDPEVLNYGTRIRTEKEGCLSIPGVMAPVVRPGTVKIRYYPNYAAWRDKRHTVQQYAGVVGRIVQHEYDHLEGRLFIDRLPPTEFVKILPQLEELDGAVQTESMKIELPFGLPLLPDKVDAPAWVPTLPVLGPQTPYRNPTLFDDWPELEKHSQTYKGGILVRLWGPHDRDSVYGPFRYFAASARGRSLLVIQPKGKPTTVSVLYREVFSVKELQDVKFDLEVVAPGWTEPLDTSNCMSLIGFVFRAPDELMPGLIRRLSREMKP